MVYKVYWGEEEVALSPAEVDIVDAWQTRGSEEVCADTVNSS